MKRYFFICILLIISTLHASAQEEFGGVVSFDKTVHNFGDVLLSDGTISCEFQMKNISAKPIVIYNVTSTCGCTDVKWGKEPILAGQTSTISATYSNDEGPYPFDKTLTVYISDYAKPILLKLRGVSHKEQESLEQLYPVTFGALGFKSAELQCGNLEIGESRSSSVLVANLSSKPLDVGVLSITEGLSMKVSPNPIPARGTASLSYTVTALPQVYGKNKYYASLLVGGKNYVRAVYVNAFSKENFSSWSAEQKKAGSNPMFATSTYSMGKVKEGTIVTARWEFSNKGKSIFKAYKVDADNENFTCEGVPEVEAGGKGSFEVVLNTSGMPKGEALVIVTLTTNSPSRPIVNLFIAGWIE